jgi:site-specific recombinase XerD
MTPLRQRLIDDLKLRNRSPRTIEAYVAHVARFARHFGRSPEELSVEHAREYQLHLIQRQVSWSNFNQCTSALRFLYRTTLERSEEFERLPYGRRPKRLPVVLSRDEVLKVLSCVANRKYRMLLTTMYATGMRISEAAALSVTDIDSRRMTILVACGKGNKQRLVPLSAKLLDELRQWWRVHRHPRWLFPGANPDRPLHIGGPQRAYQQAVRAAGLNKPASTHSLRHTFATELLEAGVNLLVIQKILGHGSLSTTAIYMHVRRDYLQSVSQTVDLLPLAQLCGQTSEPPQKAAPRRRKSAK